MDNETGPADLSDLQISAMTVCGLLQVLDERGIHSEPRAMEITMCLIRAALPLAEQLADDLARLNDGAIKST